jgi:hypothetical protein
MTRSTDAPRSAASGIPTNSKDPGFFPPRVVWAREHGWINVRDPWGQWHSIPLRQAPTGYGRLASEAKYGKR